MTLFILLIFISITCLAEECLDTTQSVTNTNPLNFENIKLIDESLSISVAKVNQAAYEKISLSDEFKVFEVDVFLLAPESGQDDKKLAMWYLNLAKMNTLAFNKIQAMGFLSDTEAERFAKSIVYQLVSGWISRALALTMHEGAHAGVAQSRGSQTSYGHDNSTSKLSLGNLFLKLVTTAGTPNTEWSGGTYDPLGLAAISASGINSQTDTGKAFSIEMIKTGRVHVTDAFNLLYNKAASGIYYFVDKSSSSSDLKGYVDALEKGGYIDSGTQTQTLEKITKMNLLTTLISGSSIDAIRAQAEYITSGKTSVDVMTWDTPIGKVTNPDFTTFLNTDNAALEMSVYAYLKNQSNIISFAVEKPVFGNKKGVELKTNIFIPKKNNYIEFGTRYNTKTKAYGLSAKAAYSIGKGWKVVAGVDYDSGKNGGTWEGSRKNYYQLKKSETIYTLGVEYFLR